jgi:hypothetical protein
MADPWPEKHDRPELTGRLARRDGGGPPALD